MNEPETNVDTQLSVLVPLHNERDNVGPLHTALSAALVPLGLRYELLFVDDGSTDGTDALLGQLDDEDPNLRVIRHDRRRGKAAALESAFACVNGAWVLVMDGDQQYDPADVPALLGALQSGGDVVSGCRDQRIDPWGRRIASRLYNALVNGLSGTRFRDHFSGIKGFRAEALQEMSLAGGLLRFPLVVAAHSGLEVREVAVRHQGRASGSSSYDVLALFLLSFSDLSVLVPYLFRSKSSPPPAS